ncbi:hypothetical protein CI102_4942 [Trichoderma harzianum]|nr:hypothetical protein CI102_4942 [Trichoderma harzianum]
MPHPRPTTNGLRPGKRETRKHPAAGTEQANQQLQDPACFMLLACLLVSIPACPPLLPTVWSIASTAGNRHLTCICTAIPHPPQSVSDTTRQLGPIGVKEWPGSSPCRSQDAQYGVTSGFRSHTKSVHMRTSHACADTSTCFVRPGPPYQPHMDDQISRKPTEDVSPFNNNGSSNRFNYYKPTRISGDQPLGTVQTRDMTNIAIAFTTTATHTTVSSPPSAPTLQPKAPRLCKGFILLILRPTQYWGPCHPAGTLVTECCFHAILS